MASNITLGTLKTKCREQANMEFSSFVSDSELVSYINDSLKSLYDMLIQSGEFYYVQSYDFQTVVNQDEYALPSTLYKVLGVDYRLGTGEARSMQRANWQDRNRYNNFPFFNTTQYAFYKYMLNGNNIRLMPTPSTGETIRLWYAPVLTDLVSDSDVIDVINGFDDYVIADVCIKMLAKEESDIQPFLIMKQDAERRVQKMKRDRIQGDTATIADVSSGQVINYYGIEF